MASFDFSRIRMQGRVALDGASYSPRKLIMIHSGVTIGLGLVLSVISYLLDMGIAQTGGLSGIGTRSVLETVQSLLETANMTLLPFWSIGYVRVILLWMRRQDGDVSTLLYGFRCFVPVIRLMFLQGIVYALLSIVGVYAGTAVFMLTPGAQPLLEVARQMLESGNMDYAALQEHEVFLSVSAAMLPYMLGAALLLIVPVAYRLRFAQFALMDQPRQGALRALLCSWRATKRNCLALLKLDLHFWWYHLAGLLIMALGYGDMLLPLVGIELGISADAAMFAFYIAALLCEFGLYVWKKNEVFAVYALAYDELTAAEQQSQQNDAR